MMVGDLPPTGEAICLDGAGPLPAFSGYCDLWLNSGTAALALAMLHAHWQRLEITHPEVVLPAYGCPDLVAAAVYAGVKPVLVDVNEDDPAYDLDALQNAMNDNTVAVVAVNFLGIAERLKAIRQRLPSGVMLIEDNAQWHPEPDVQLEGDYVVASFGRGKPASVLGGGLLLVRKDIPLNREWVKEHFSEELGAFPSVARHRLKAITYNILRRPAAYFWLNRSGLFKLGETRYTPLQGIANMSPACQRLVRTNIQQHLLQDRWREGFYDQLVGDNPSLAAVAHKRRRRLLRYPILCASLEQRNTLLQTLSRQGLGASPMYRQCLAEIPGVADKVELRQAASNAASFANRFLTLPLHSGVTKAHLHKIASTLENVGMPEQPSAMQSRAEGAARLNSR